MTVRSIVSVLAASLVAGVFVGTPAAAACCDHGQKAQAACCEDHAPPCCQHGNDLLAASILIPEYAPEPRPARESVTVWFNRPVKVGDRILLGKYVIEHDNDRMARGEPCTYIYAAANQRLPVVAFHCTHLDRPTTDRASVVMRPLGESNGMQELLSFQFAGEVGAHGVPADH